MSNRYVIDTNNPKQYLRDIDKLMEDYANLRYALYYRFSKGMSPIRKEELIEYINEQFIKLVKEYDIHSNVDFPGYIKNKLTMRVRNSYVKKNFKMDNDFILGLDGNTIEDMTEDYYSDLELNSIIDYIMSCREYTELENDILLGLINPSEKDEVTLLLDISEKRDLPYKTVRSTFIKLKKDLKEMLYKHEETNKRIDYHKVNTNDNTWEL